MERKIGSTFLIPSGKTLRVEEKKGCDICAVHNTSLCRQMGDTIVGRCTSREDGKSVQFIEYEASKAKFQVGDVVRIAFSGDGAGSRDLGKISTIVEIGDYCGQVGYKIDPPWDTNSKTGQYDYMVGESTFEKVLTSDKLEVGDLVELVNLDVSGRDRLVGNIGHQATISEIKSSGWIRLNPTCVGGSWPASCFKLIKKGNTSLSTNSIKSDTSLPELQQIVTIFLEVPKI